MGDFVKNHLLHIVIAGFFAEMSRQSDALGPVVTLTEPGHGPVPFETPFRKQTVGGEE
jgi:hypothetical protein